MLSVPLTCASLPALTPAELSSMLTPFDLKRMEAYSDNMLDYHVVLDLLPTIASLYFTRRLGQEVSLAAAQQAILLALGLQRKSIEDVESELRVPVSQGLALFVKVMRKITRALRDIQKSALAEEIPLQEPEVQRNVGDGNEDGVQQGTKDWRPMATTVEEDLEEVVDEETKLARAMQRELIDSIDLSKCVCP
jgi:N-acetyltransferase 10